MPHVTIEYSGNLESAVDMHGLCEALRESAAGLDALPMPGIRVRAVRVDHYAIADGNPKHAFIDIAVRLRGGRTLEVRKHAVQTLFDTAQVLLAPVMATRSVALSMEMRDIDPELSPKSGSIREHLEGE